MVHRQLRAVIGIASLYLLSLVALSVRDLQGVDVQNLWSATDWVEFLGLCGLYIVTGLLGLMTVHTLSLRMTRWFGTAWWCCTALSASSTLGFVALLFRKDRDATAKELFAAVHQYDLKFSATAGAARPGGSLSARTPTPPPLTMPRGGTSGYRGRGYTSCHDGILYGERDLYEAAANADGRPPAGWFEPFVREAILNSVLQVVFMTLVCLATARLQAYLEECMELQDYEDCQEKGDLLAMEVAEPLLGSAREEEDGEEAVVVIRIDEKQREALVAAGYLEALEKPAGEKN